MKTEETRALLRDAIEAYQRGDFEHLFERYDEDIVFTIHAPVTIFPITGPCRGKQAVIDVIKAIGAQYEFKRQDIETMIVENDRAALVADMTMVQRRTGRVMRFRLAAFYRYRGRKLIEYRQFVDSFDLAEQAVGRAFTI